jgi:tetratricopeptide (TPR) repeat protein
MEIKASSGLIAMRNARSICVVACVIALSLFSVGQDPAKGSAGAPQNATGYRGLRLPVRAKTHDEYVAYQAAVAKLPNLDEAAKAAGDFAAKFPDSNLRVLLYQKLMKACQKAGDSDKTLDAGLKILAINKDDPEALVGVAEIQEEHTTPMDLDRDQRMQQAMTNARHALQTIDTDLTIPANTKPEQMEPYRKYLRAAALAIIGTLQYQQQQYPEAEATLRNSLQADADNPDPVVLVRLALVLDQEKKYDDALQQANRAVEITKEDTEVGKVARTEQQRLTLLTVSTTTPAPQDNSTPAQDPAPPGH